MEQKCKHCNMLFETDTKEYFCEDCRFLKNEKIRQSRRVIYHREQLEKRIKRLNMVENQLVEREMMSGDINR